MPTARRTKSNSITNAVEAYRKVGRSIPWPAEVTELPEPADSARARAIYARLLEARDLADWRPGDILLVAQLANAHAQADNITQDIERVGWTIPSPKNPLQLLRNPMLDALTLISSRQLSLTRALGLNGPPSDRRTISNNRRAAADARDTLERGGPDSLLAQPVVQQ